MSKPFHVMIDSDGEVIDLAKKINELPTPTNTSNSRLNLNGCVHIEKECDESD